MYRPGMKMEDAKAEFIKSALDYHKDNRVETARAIGVSINSLRMWIRRYPQLKSYRREPHWDGKRKELKEIWGNE